MLCLLLTKAVMSNTKKLFKKTPNKGIENCLPFLVLFEHLNL